MSFLAKQATSSVRRKRNLRSTNVFSFGGLKLLQEGGHLMERNLFPGPSVGKEIKKTAKTAKPTPRGIRRGGKGKKPNVPLVQKSPTETD